MKRKPFLQWSLFASLIIVFGIIAASLGWSRYVWSDPTHITLVTLSVFAIATMWCGRQTWRLAGGRDPSEIEDSLENGWFASSLCVSIGLIGTAIGFFLMLQAVGTVNPEEMVRKIQSGMSISLVNTVIGGICGLLVEVQSHFIGRAAKRARKAAS